MLQVMNLRRGAIPWSQYQDHKGHKDETGISGFGQQATATSRRRSAKQFPSLGQPFAARPGGQDLINSVNLRELHDMRIVSAPCRILPPSGLRYHITAVPEAKFIQHRVIAPFPPEDIVTLFQQLLLFKKSFTHFFRSLANGLFRP